MDKLRVTIDNWQHNPWYHEWVPIFIALISLITSLISLYWNRKENIISRRPYVWASNYGVIDNVQKTIIPIPFRVAFRIINSPVKPSRKIGQLSFIQFCKFKLFNYEKKKLYRKQNPFDHQAV
jgi:hypothetical protein